MCSMCHYCDSEQSEPTNEKSNQENGSSLRLNGGGPVSSCKICREKQDNLSLYSTPMISPTNSLSSNDRSFSSCSEFSVDGNSCDRGRADKEEAATNEILKENRYRMNGQSQHIRLEGSGNGLDRSNIMAGQSLKNGSYGNYCDIERDPKIEKTTNGQEGKVNEVEDTAISCNEASESSHSVDCGINIDVWDPPESEDPEDDVEGGMTYNDDDDDDNDGFGDDTRLGEASSLSHWREEGSGRHKFKEEKQRAMEEVISGKFKSIVRQLLKSVGATSYTEDGESWVDIVTSLSWEAASFLKPSAIDGKAMDLNWYVKVKCIATGSRSQSQVIKGLVFKKHAAHKHMPTKYKNARLLLIRDVLGQSSSGLSSFNAMEEQEKDYLRSVMEMIEMCHPNVVLVEKTVSRGIQEAILEKGMTLVLDMKLHRLQRIARCTGSPILSTDKLTSPKLKQCESFHIEKFIEEHAALVDGGKKPSKTLMFIEGCPTRLGCTVLLKGSNTDELKRIKYVVQCAVVMAYHLILETSFLVDQRAMFSTIISSTGLDDLPTCHQGPALENGNFTPCSQECKAETEPDTVDIPISNGYHEDSSCMNAGLEGDSILSYEPYNPAIFAGLSTLSSSLKKVIGDNFSLSSAGPYPTFSSLFGFHGKENGQITEEVPVSRILEVSDAMDDKNISDDERLDGNEPSLSASSENLLLKDCGNDEEELQSKDSANSALDSQSILVLMSSRNALRGTICEQSHFSHIMFYKNFDIPLGKFLQDNLLNQKLQCATCGELPEAHFYYYAHHKKQLTIQVKRLPQDKCLPGEAQGKLWMWSRCGKCKIGNNISKSTKKVLISTASCGLSFGKFLELGFSHRPSFGRLSSCGHSPHRDFLYFFGLGPMVAMFRYSSVTTYSISVPPQKLEFTNSIDKEWLDKEVRGLYNKGMELFTEVESSLTKIGAQFLGCTLNLRGSVKDFSFILEMLKHEHAAFKLNIQNAVAKNGNSDEAFHKLLSLNWLRWEFLLESCIWGKRLHSLVSRDPTVVITGGPKREVHGQCKLKMNGPIVRVNEEPEINNGTGDTVCNDSDNSEVQSESAETNDILDNEVPDDGVISQSKIYKDQYNNTSTVAEDTKIPNGSACHYSCYDGLQLKNLPISENLEMDHIKVRNSLDEAKEDSTITCDFLEEIVSPSSSLVSSVEKLNGWYWMPFSKLSQIYMKDLRRGYEPKLESLLSYTSEYLPSVYQNICEENARSHIPIGTDNYIVSDFEGELSSIIACVLASSFKDVKEEGSFRSLSGVSNLSSPQWSFSSSTDSDVVHSTLNSGSRDPRLSSSDGSEMQSPDVSKSFGNGKYSVKCLYPTQFRNLRSRCCPSELDYIDSLSRCRNWDAKGGKSKSFFAKTLDNRFIIKEIKKTEFDSFVKFAVDYFNYMNQSINSGNQTCLAKVLGIYQVTARQTKGGKEMRHVLMVMENLTFGRNVIRQYDLKGALHARFNAVFSGSGDVLLDQNFVNDMNTSPLYVSKNAKRLLERAVWNDTSFLNSIDVMDYSLLVGVDAERRELVCGIIDYLRQYTWDKHLETWVKSSLVPKNVLPTVISPIEYKKRFRGFMSRHFLSVPDDWCLEEPSDPCELCGNNDNSSKSV